MTLGGLGTSQSCPVSPSGMLSLGLWDFPGCGTFSFETPVHRTVTAKAEKSMQMG